MPCDWRPFVELVSRRQRFLLTTHVRSDGDALGCEQALAFALRKLGKQAVLTVPDYFPDRYDFLDPNKEFVKFTPPGEALREAEVFIVVDTGTWGQLAPMADFIRSLKTDKIVIDHHMTQDDLGAQRFVDTTAEACGRLIHEAIQALGVPVTPEIATALFVALATDTGWFRHGNVTPATYTLAAELMQAGARPDYLYQQIFERNTIPRLKLMGQVLGRLTMMPNRRVVYSDIRLSDYLSTGAIPPDSEDLVNFTVSMAGVDIGLLFMEQPRGGVKVSFRSRGGTNVAKIAEQFGGGGHKQAAGATIMAPMDEVRLKVLIAVEKALSQS